MLEGPVRDEPLKWRARAQDAGHANPKVGTLGGPKHSYRDRSGTDSPMKRFSPVVVAIALALAALLALPYVTVADATDRAVAISKARQGYRTCFVQNRPVFVGPPRIERIPHCVYQP